MCTEKVDVAQSSDSLWIPYIFSRDWESKVCQHHWLSVLRQLSFLPVSYLHHIDPKRGHACFMGLSGEGEFARARINLSSNSTSSILLRRIEHLQIGCDGSTSNFNPSDFMKKQQTKLKIYSPYAMFLFLVLLCNILSWLNKRGNV